MGAQNNGEGLDLLPPFIPPCTSSDMNHSTKYLRSIYYLIIIKMFICYSLFVGSSVFFLGYFGA